MIHIFETVVEYSKGIGYVRAIQAPFQQLGESLFSVGELKGAGAAYLGSLGVSEEMGAVHEMADTLIRVAEVSAEMGRKEEAAMILAGVLADPISRRSTMISTASISELATELLKGIRKDLEAQQYDTAYATGSATGIARSAKELLTT